MATGISEPCTLQAAPELLAALHQIADSQGRQFQTVVEEALLQYVERQKNDQPRRTVMTAFSDSLKEFDSLYQDLAK